MPSFTDLALMQLHMNNSATGNMRNPFKFLNAHYLTYPSLVQGMVMSYMLIYWYEAASSFHCTEVKNFLEFLPHFWNAHYDMLVSIVFTTIAMEFTLYIQNDQSSSVKSARKTASCSTFQDNFKFPKVSVWQVLIGICPCSNLHVWSYVYWICGWVQTLTIYKYRRPSAEEWSTTGQTTVQSWGRCAASYIHLTASAPVAVRLGHLMLFVQRRLAQFQNPSTLRHSFGNLISVWF